MENVIQTLRKFDGAEGENWSEEREEIDAILDTYKPEGYSKKKVHHEFEHGGRWYNVETDVYEVEQDGEVAYFEYWSETPASEVQEGMDLSWGFYEVEPQEVTVIKYVAKEAKS